MTPTGVLARQPCVTTLGSTRPRGVGTGWARWWVKLQRSNPAHSQCHSGCTSWGIRIGSTRRRPTAQSAGTAGNKRHLWRQHHEQMAQRSHGSAASGRFRAGTQLGGEPCTRDGDHPKLNLIRSSGHKSGNQNSPGELLMMEGRLGVKCQPHRSSRKVRWLRFGLPMLSSSPARQSTPNLCASPRQSGPSLAPL